MEEVKKLKKIGRENLKKLDERTSHESKEQEKIDQS